ncbi:MAG: polysaccharide biosynthesis tyrosine autokinase [Acidimicrobiales bacterium]
MSRNLVLGTVAGLIVGTGVALLRESLDQSLNNADTVSQVTGLPVLASIPDPGRRFALSELALSVRDVPDGVVADGYARLRTAFQFVVAAAPVASVVVTSANQSEGKTTTSTNLAHSLGAVGTRVVLADLDFRRPRIHSIYGVVQSPGVTDLVINGQLAAEVSYLPDPSTGTLALLTAGASPPDPATFVASDPIEQVIRSLEKECDVLILDAPPILPVSDALSLSRHADGVLLVVNAKTTKRRDAEQAMKSLKAAGANVIGAVLVGVRASDGYGRYGQGYGTD